MAHLLRPQAPKHVMRSAHLSSPGTDHHLAYTTIAELRAQCGNDVLSMGAHVGGVLRLDVRASLSVKLVDERLQLVDRYRWLAAVQRPLGAVELGEQTLSNARVVNMAIVDRVLDAGA